MQQHKIPIHLEQEDKFLLGMTARQCLVIAVGGTLAYAALPSDFSSLSSVIIGLIVSALLFLATLAVAFIRVQHRDLEQWMLIGLMYLSQPKCFLWHPVLDDAPEEDEKAPRARTTETKGDEAWR